VKTRILKVHLAELLARKKLPTLALSKAIGISAPTVDKMLAGDWKYIAREAIERSADYLKVEVSELFELVPVPFWDWVEESKQCTFLRGSHDDNGNRNGLRIPGSDSDATAEITRFTRRFMRSDTYADHERNIETLIDRAKNENCIVIGGPRTNAATEILLSAFFGREPFKAHGAKNSKLPFCYCWPESGHIEVESSLACPDPVRRKFGGKPGIVIKDRLIEADYIEPGRFTNTAMTKPAKDCGLVFVANKPFGTTKNVKLIVLAGFGGIGTFGAAKALIDDFRYLEPLPNESCVYGVVQCSFTKAANSDIKKLTGRVTWGVRKGGHFPINEPEVNEAKVIK
jgi:DNA-binding Xre family transcriptional regulator